MTAGADQGTEYPFDDGQEAKLGRTADNDVVVKDAAASRSHARVFQKGAKYFVEDLGSANGTIVNQTKIADITELRRADTIVIGDVVLTFMVRAPARAAPDSTVADESDEEPPDEFSEPDDDPSATVLKPKKALRPALPHGRTRGAPEFDPDDVAHDAGPHSHDDDEPSQESNSSTRAVNVPPPRALVKATAQSIRPARESAASTVAPLSAAARARARRQMQQSSSGRLQLMWEDMSTIARAALVGFMALLLLGSIGLVAWAVRGTRKVEKVEPMVLLPNASSIEDTFGLGDGTVFHTPDQKTFTFATTSPTRVVGVLHYQARNISRDEVTISLNGVDLGSVPPDTMNADTRELDLVLPAVVLHTAEEENTLVFDNVNNPPASDTWHVWNVWVEINPVPDLTTEEAERRAQQEIDRATILAERRDIGAENLFTAWKTYREAWLLLEATPSHSTELDAFARSRMRDLRLELDKKCNAMIIDVKKALNQKTEDIARARAILDDVRRYFPGREHPCLGFSQAMLRDLESVDEVPEK